MYCMHREYRVSGNGNIVIVVSMVKMAPHGQSAVELSLLRFALGGNRKTEGVGPRRRAGEESTGSSSVAHLGPFIVLLAGEDTDLGGETTLLGGEGGIGVCSGNICSTPSSSSSSLSVKSMIWRFRFCTTMGFRKSLGPGRFMISGEELFASRVREGGAGLDLGVGNIGFVSEADARGMQFYAA